VEEICPLDLMRRGSKPAYDSARELLPEETGSNRWAESTRGQTALGDCRGIYFK